MSEFHDYLKEALQEFGEVTIRRMFGGAGVFRDGLMFGLIADDVLYFKVDDASRAAFEAEECAPFTYVKKGKPSSMNYYRVPERLYDDDEEMCEWARAAYSTALRARK